MDQCGFIHATAGSPDSPLQGTVHMRLTLEGSRYVWLPSEGAGSLYQLRLAPTASFCKAVHEHVQVEQDVERVLLSCYGPPLACIYICSGSARLSESGRESNQPTLVRGLRISGACTNSQYGRAVFSVDLT